MATKRTRTTVDPAHRFMHYVSPEPMSGCWLWAGGFMGNGYATMSFQGKAKKASRFSYETFKGPLEQDEVVRHMCHNPGCVNPEHLEKGSHKDNNNDMWEAGRGVRKLSDEDVLGILKDYIPFEFGLLKVSKKYGCSKRNVLDIVKGRKFKRLQGLEA